MVYLGNQTACWAATPLEPFEYALANGFDAFEWFPDKKPGAGWDEQDLDPDRRRRIRAAAQARGLRQSVHARWQANPLRPESHDLFQRDLELARDLGAVLLNIHLHHEEGLPAYVAAITPLIRLTAEAHLQLAIENTPHHAPEVFHDLFALLRQRDGADHVGFCLDLGHANLCSATQNDYLAFVDRLGPHVPIIHLHLHENWGDADRHLPLFTGPSARDDSGIRGFLDRMRQRNFSGSIILEQWPQPPTLLNTARDRLLQMLAEQRRARGQPADAARGVTDREPVPPVRKFKAQSSKLKLPSSSSSVVLETRFMGPLRVGSSDLEATHEPAPPAAGWGERPREPLREDSHPVEATGDRTAGLGRRSRGEVGSSGAPPHGKTRFMASVPSTTPANEFADTLVAANQRCQSWREKLDFVRGLLADDASPPTTAQLVDLAIYLRFLSTGQIACAEDGRHFRPAHHARISGQIQESLARRTTPENAFILRSIYPWLPSSAPTFQRAEPLTRIRDIAHRNDIPSDLKREIKHTLQNKLHRCAGPEDLVTSSTLLARITAPGANFSPDFVAQFRVFHEELTEFFNARSLESRLEALLPQVNAGDAALLRSFLEQKSGTAPGSPQRAFGTLTEIRRRLFALLAADPGPLAQDLWLADLGLDDFAFVLLSQILNGFDTEPARAGWEVMLETMLLTIAQVRLSQVEPDESSAIESEWRAWTAAFDVSRREHLLRLKATADRIRRLAGNHSHRILSLFAPRAEILGRALGVEDHAIRVLGEAEIRRQTIFQLSKLASMLLRRLREALALPPWDVLVSGEAVGRVTTVASLDQWEAHDAEPSVLLLRTATGDEEIPIGAAALVLAHDMPHLSHLGVRARQAGVVFATCEEDAEFRRLEGLQGQIVALTACPDGVEWRSTTLDRTSSPPSDGGENSPDKCAPCAPEPGRDGIRITSRIRSRSGDSAFSLQPLAFPVRGEDAGPEVLCLSLEDAVPALAGGKAGGVRRLAELARKPGAGFKAPAGVVVPFGVLERALQAAPELGAEYEQRIRELDALPTPDFVAATGRLRAFIQELQVPEEIPTRVAAEFGSSRRFMVRSSANAEDLPGLAGAGLYDSVANVALPELMSAIRTVWASLWSERAATSRQHMAIPPGQARMAVLIQPMLAPDFSFVIHTVNPLTRNRDEAYVEIAVGLGETLASGAARGSAYRLVCAKTNGTLRTLALANFSHALRAQAAGGVQREVVDYAQVALSRDDAARLALGRRLAWIARFVEEAFGSPQDIEGALLGDEIHLLQSRPQVGNLRFEI